MNIYEAKARLSALIQAVECGDKVIINGASHALLRRDFANVSNATASTMITPMMICWM